MQYDIVIIGGGPAGYVCAIKASQLGFKVACVEKNNTLGGTCLNVGCIPSKALLKATKLYEYTANELDKFGITAKGVSFDLSQMLGHKEVVIKKLTQGIEMLFKKNKVEYIQGVAKFLDKNTLDVDGQKITAENIVIATGSVPATLPNIQIDEEKIVSSTGALSLQKVPENMVVIGGGYIGLELGSIWNRLGAKVTVVEFLDTITPQMDKEVSGAFKKSLEKQGFEFKLSTKVVAAEKIGDKVKLTLEPSAGGDAEVMEVDVALVSIGRRPNTANLGLETVGVELNKHGTISVNEKYQTSIGNIYAIGDVIDGAMLAHKAEEEAVAVAEIIAGQAGHVNYDCIPSVVYTSPEVASVGKTEQELKSAGIDYKIGKFPMAANGRAIAEGKTEGFVKILACRETDRVLGVHIIGDDAGNMIAEAVMAMEYSASSEDIARTCHAHPTISEVIKEAALDVDKMALHK